MEWMFGTSGIRGIYGKDITPELALRLANAFAETDVCIGRDTRGSGVPLAFAAMSGVLSSGHDGIGLGIAPTPLVAFASMKYGCGGLMVTASHNPAEYNGLKFMRKGREISRAEEKRVLERHGGGMGYGASPGERRREDVIPEYMELVKKNVDTELIAKKKPKVVVDCNGAGAVVTPYLLRELGCKVVSLNCETRGFNRPSEPNKENLSWLSSAVRSCGADFGIAHDGDADRCAIVDERGELLNADVQLALMVGEELARKKGKIISSVESSLIVKETVEGNGGRFVLTPVGSVHVSEEMEKSGAVFGGEPAGEYVFRGGVLVPDGVMAAAKYVELFCGKGKLSVLASRFKTNPMAREKFKTADRVRAMEKIAGTLKLEGKRETGDGIRIDGEGYWVLVRASGTESIIRLTAEAKTKELLDKVCSKAREAIRNAV
ncbi:MAG: phosphoglucosamine mutase [Candidatus ainarchaeum sp.]|nr:phosphoglucosamine mutase [Candidatus ainarchaeum sp.]